MFQNVKNHKVKQLDVSFCENPQNETNVSKCEIPQNETFVYTDIGGIDDKL